MNDSKNKKDPRKHIAMDAPYTKAPFHQAVELLPGIRVVLEAESYQIRPADTSGWIFIVINGVLKKIAFKLVSSWPSAALKCLQSDSFSRKLMRSLHPLFMVAKLAGRVEHFQIKGLCFSKTTTFGPEYRTY